jgi:hypothetical protein
MDGTMSVVVGVGQTKENSFSLVETKELIINSLINFISIYIVMIDLVLPCR